MDQDIFPGAVDFKGFAIQAKFSSCHDGLWLAFL